MPRPEPLQPSAPPIHMMPAANLDDSVRDRSPPPRYEEAIADDNNQYQPSFPSSRGVPPATSQQPAPPLASSRAPLSPVRGSQGAAQHHQRRPNSCNPSPPSPNRNHRRARSSNSARHRSASPGDLSDGSFDRAYGSGQQCADSNQTDGGSDGGAGSRSAVVKKKKRSSGSKIKKGLENIAFFIIQILD